MPKEDWDTLRRRVYARANYKCEVCGGKGPTHPVECHEVWEYDEKNKVQKLIGLIALCPDCHSVKHWGLAQMRGKEQECAAHLMKVNGWDADTAKAHVIEAFNTWLRRNKIKKWKLDASWLDKELLEKGKQ